MHTREYAYGITVICRGTHTHTHTNTHTHTYAPISQVRARSLYTLYGRKLRNFADTCPHLFTLPAYAVYGAILAEIQDSFGERSPVFLHAYTSLRAFIALSSPANLLNIKKNK